MPYVVTALIAAIDVVMLLPKRQACHVWLERALSCKTKLQNLAYNVFCSCPVVSVKNGITQGVVCCVHLQRVSHCQCCTWLMPMSRCEARPASQQHVLCRSSRKGLLSMTRRRMTRLQALVKTGATGQVKLTHTHSSRAMITLHLHQAGSSNKSNSPSSVQ